MTITRCHRIDRVFWYLVCGLVKQELHDRNQMMFLYPYQPTLFRTNPATIVQYYEVDAYHQGDNGKIQRGMYQPRLANYHCLNKLGLSTIGV